MNLGDHVRLNSVTFKEPVRLPGTGSSGHYIPAEDYPLRYFPALGLIEGRVKDTARPMPGHPRKRWYHASNSKDMDVDESSLSAEDTAGAPAVQGGAVIVPEARMRRTAGGGFERVTDAEQDAGAVPHGAQGDPATAHDVAHETGAAPAAKRGGWPKGKARGKKPAAAPEQAPQAAPIIPGNIPAVRAQVHGGQRGD